MRKYLADRLYESAENTNYFWLDGVGQEQEVRNYLDREASLLRLWKLYCDDVYEECIEPPYLLKKVARAWAWVTYIYPRKIKRVLGMRVTV